MVLGVFRHGFINTRDELNSYCDIGLNKALGAAIRSDCRWCVVIMITIEGVFWGGQSRVPKRGLYTVVVYVGYTGELRSGHNFSLDEKVVWN